MDIDENKFKSGVKEFREKYKDDQIIMKKFDNALAYEVIIIGVISCAHDNLKKSLKLFTLIVFFIELIICVSAGYIGIKKHAYAPIMIIMAIIIFILGARAKKENTSKNFLKYKTCLNNILNSLDSEIRSVKTEFPDSETADILMLFTLRSEILELINAADDII